MKNDYNEQFEGNVLKEMDQAVSSIKNELTPLLDQKVKEQSAIDHTMSLLDTNVINQALIQNSMNNGQGQTNTNERVRVRTMDGPNHFVGTVSNNAESVNNRPMYGNEPYEDIDTNWKTGGYTETLILVGTAVLVILVFMVTYLMLNYFG